MSAATASRRRFTDAALIAVFVVTSLYAIARIGMEPRDPASGVGVIFAPWTSEQAAFVRAVEAGARFVRYGGVPFIVVVMPEVDDYPSRIRAAGALLVVDPRVIAACLDLFKGSAAAK